MNATSENAAAAQSRKLLPRLIAGPAIALIVWMIFPQTYIDSSGELVTLSSGAAIVAAVAALMALWWMTEAIPVYVTAMAPLVLFPAFGVADIKIVAGSYGHPVIYLFLGGFLLALALEKWDLHKRLALSVLVTVGANPRRIIAAFMGVSAFLSMWVMNTSTTIMLLPVAVSVIALLPGESLAKGATESPFALCLLLGIAYAASIGGMGTIIGTAPNAFVVSFISDELGRDIGFLEWMRFAVPLVIVFVPLAWLVLTYFVYPVSGSEIEGAKTRLRAERDALQPMNRGSWLTLFVFLMTATAWISRPFINQLEINGYMPFSGISDAGIAMAAAMLLFILPAKLRRAEFLLDWEATRRLPWGLLILFGGGLSLASQLSATGVSAYLGQLAALLQGLPVWLILALIIATVVFLTELTSNVATTATLVPVFVAVADGLDLPPMMLVIPATLAASCAFMLPVATPPNAVVFGSGYLHVSQMSKAGFWLNLLAIILISISVWLVVVPMLGLELL